GMNQVRCAMGVRQKGVDPHSCLQQFLREGKETAPSWHRRNLPTVEEEASSIELQSGEKTGSFSSNFFKWLLRKGVETRPAKFCGGESGAVGGREWRSAPSEGEAYH